MLPGSPCGEGLESEVCRELGSVACCLKSALSSRKPFVEAQKHLLDPICIGKSSEQPCICTFLQLLLCAVFERVILLFWRVLAMSYGRGRRHLRQQSAWCRQREPLKRAFRAHYGLRAEANSRYDRPESLLHRYIVP